MLSEYGAAGWSYCNFETYFSEGILDFCLFRVIFYGLHHYVMFGINKAVQLLVQLKVIFFYGFYHSKSPLNSPPFGRNMLVIFSNDLKP